MRRRSRSLAESVNNAIDRVLEAEFPWHKFDPPKPKGGYKVPIKDKYKYKNEPHENIFWDRHFEPHIPKTGDKFTIVETPSDFVPFLGTNVILRSKKVSGGMTVSDWVFEVIDGDYKGQQCEISSKDDEFSLVWYLGEPHNNFVKQKIKFPKLPYRS